MSIPRVTLRIHLTCNAECTCYSKKLPTLLLGNQSHNDKEKTQKLYSVIFILQRQAYLASAPAAPWLFALIC